MIDKTDSLPAPLSKTVQIVNDLGLHARAASIIAKKAKSARSAIWVTKGNITANAASIIDLLMLECPKGSWITVKTDNPSDGAVFNDIVQSIESGFGE
jgi:phosphocarrier protein HPr